MADSNSDQDTQSSFRELQILEQQYQALMMQKQQAQIEQLELTNAKDEVAKTQGEVYKILGSAMILSDKKTVGAELEQKAKQVQMRLDTMQKQEKEIESHIAELQGQIKQHLSRDKNSKK
jgi:prefoldin beta subunit